MTKTSELTEKYIDKHRSVKDCLQEGLVNYSALSRKISKELGLEKKTSIEAILIAARRYAEKIRKDRSREVDIKEILKGGELEIRNKVVVVILDTFVYKDNLREMQKKVESKADFFHTIEGSKTITIVTLDKYLDKIKEIFKRNIIKINRDMIEIVIKSPPDIEKTPGVVSYIVRMFAENDVNIYELSSCWTDTMIVVSEEDIGKVMGFLKF